MDSALNPEAIANNLSISALSSKLGKRNHFEGFRYLVLKNNEPGSNMPQCKAGFLYEKYHAYSFNKSCASKSIWSLFFPKYSARTVDSKLKGSVDIAIKNNSSGKDVANIQAKHYKNPNKAVKSFEKGKYEGQERLSLKTNKAANINDRIKVDGVESQPIKDHAKMLKLAKETNESAAYKKKETEKYEKKMAFNQAAEIGAVQLGTQLAEGVFKNKSSYQVFLDTGINTAVSCGAQLITSIGDQFIDNYISEAVPGLGSLLMLYCGINKIASSKETTQDKVKDGIKIGLKTGSICTFSFLIPIPIVGSLLGSFVGSAAGYALDG